MTVAYGMDAFQLLGTVEYSMHVIGLLDLQFDESNGVSYPREKSWHLNSGKHLSVSQSVNMPGSREAEIARILTTNTLSSTGEDWLKLVQDYFLTPAAPAITAESESESESDSAAEGEEDGTGDEGGEVPEDVEMEEEAGESEEEVDEDEDEPLMTDQAASVLCVVQEEFVSEDASEEMKRVREFKCSCKMNSGTPCFSHFTPEEMVRKRGLMMELTSGK